MDEYNPHLRALVLEVVENQIRSNDPPETKKALHRLMQSGYSRQQAKEKIAVAVVEQIWQVMHDKKPFDEAAYAQALQSIQ